MKFSAGAIRSRVNTRLGRHRKELIEGVHSMTMRHLPDLPHMAGTIGRRRVTAGGGAETRLARHAAAGASGRAGREFDRGTGADALPEDLDDGVGDREDDASCTTGQRLLTIIGSAAEGQSLTFMIERLTLLLHRFKRADVEGAEMGAGSRRSGIYVTTGVG